MKKPKVMVSDKIQKLLIVSVMITVVALMVDCIGGLMAFLKLAPESPIYPSLLSAAMPVLFFFLYFTMMQREKLIPRLYHASLIWIVGAVVMTITTIILSIQVIPYDVYTDYLLGYLNVIGWIVAALGLALIYFTSKSVRKNWKSILYKSIDVGMTVATVASLLVVLSLVISAGANARSFAGFIGPFLTAEFGINCLIVVSFGASYLLVNGTSRLHKAYLIAMSTAFLASSFGLLMSGITNIIRY